MKAIIIEGVLKFQNSFKEFNGTVGLEYATEQQWYDWGFREYVVPTVTKNQYIGDFYLDTINDIITYYIIDKTQEEIEVEFNNVKINTIIQFETDTDNLIKQVVGERANEYEIAEKEAIEYKAAGYPELDIPQSISSDAIANNRTNIEACDLIITMADNWRALQVALRANRLLAKAATKNATTLEDILITKENWDNFISYIRTQIIG